MNEKWEAILPILSVRPKNISLSVIDSELGFLDTISEDWSMSGVCSSKYIVRKYLIIIH